MRSLYFVLTLATAITALAAADASAYDCPATPPAMKDIRAQGYYADSAGSIVDEDKKREGAEMTRPLNDFLKQVTGMSDRYLADKDTSAAECAIAWLDGWAQGGAMLGRMVHVNNDQSEYMRQWMHGGLAVAYLKTRDAATEAQRAHIEPWLKELGAANMAYWMNNPKKKRNNHFYWTGVGIMATAVATGDKRILNEASSIYAKGISDILDDGSLPMEMARGQRALHYHDYALAPLVLMAELARVDGLDLYAYQDHRIDLLAQRVVSGYRDSAWFAQQAGIAQEIHKPGADTGWVEFYRLRTSHPEVFDALHNAGPFDEPRMGGDLSLMARVGIVASHQE